MNSDQIQNKIFEQCKTSRKVLAANYIKFRTKLSASGGGDKDTFADMIVCLDFYYKKLHSEKELQEIIIDSRKDCGIDVLVVRKNEVDLFDIKINDAGVNLVEIKSVIDKYIRIRPADYSQIKNVILENALRRLHEVSVTKINLIIIREFKTEKQRRDIERKCNHIKNKDINVLFFNRSELILHQQNKYDAPQIFLESTKLYNGNDSDIDWAVTIVDLSKLIEQYCSVADTDVFFSKNIRKPQGDLKQKNILIRSLKQNPETFHYRHNGIVMTGDRIQLRGNSLEVVLPQVLNGAQTLGILSMIYKENKKILRNAKILVKVLSVKDQVIIDDICEAANTQKSVSTADIRTNDLLQKNLELFINNLGEGKYFYCRGKINPQIKKHKKKSSTIIEKESFIQWANSAFRQRPYESKNQKNKLFVKSFSENNGKEPYEEIKELIIKHWDDIPLLCRVAVFVADSIKKMPKQIRNDARIMDQHLITSIFSSVASKIRKDENDFLLEESFSKYFTYYINKYDKAVKESKDNLNQRSYFISEKSFN